MCSGHSQAVIRDLGCWMGGRKQGWDAVGTTPQVTLKMGGLPHDIKRGAEEQNFIAFT